ncbi:response regulator [Bdellovibrionota bacterium FG-1]
MAKILIVEDSATMRNNVVRLLRATKKGYEFAEAINGKEALACLSETRPDCILCDILMPVMDGLTFLESLKAAGIKIPVIMLTADIQNQVKARCLELGALAVLTKPMFGLPTELLEAIEQGVSSGRQL